MKRPGAIEAIRSIPSMGVIGEQDQTVPAILAEGFLREIWPDAPFIQLPKVSHFAQEDAPETLLAIIDHFIQSN